MSVISQIRSIIQDQPLCAKETIAADGVQTQFQVTYYPVIGSSVVITPNTAHTVDEQNGVVVFNAAPGLGSLVFVYTHVNLLDSTIQDYIDINDDGADVRLPAADALDAIADNQSLIQKKIKLLDLETDGPAVADSLRKHAESLRSFVLGNDQAGDFDIAEQVYDEPSKVEYINKLWEKEGAL